MHCRSLCPCRLSAFRTLPAGTSLVRVALRVIRSAPETQPEGKAMKRVVKLVTVLVLVASAVTVSAQTTVVVGQAPAVGKYSGEVWTWDSARSIVTLYDAGT